MKVRRLEGVGIADSPGQSASNLMKVWTHEGWSVVSLQWKEHTPLVRPAHVSRSVERGAREGELGSPS